MPKIHLLSIADVKWALAHQKFRPQKYFALHSEEAQKNWVEHHNRYPRAMCGEYIKNIETASNPLLATCKVCLKAYKAHQKDTKEMKRRGLL